jgi:hypothetical protein
MARLSTGMNSTQFSTRRILPTRLPLYLIGSNGVKSPQNLPGRLFEVVGEYG